MAQPEHEPMVIVRDYGANIAALLGAVLAVVVIAAGVGGYALLEVDGLASANKKRALDAKALAAKLDMESKDRVGQQCRLFIGSHRAAGQILRSEQRRLANTIAYLADAPKPLRGIDLGVQRNLPAVRTDVREARREVAASRPPPYCDKHR